MALGRLLGQGRTADVYEYGDGRVIKLLRPGFPSEMLTDETRLTKLAVEAGAPAPEVHGLETQAGRSGIVMDIAPGESLLELVLTDPGRWRAWADVLAGAHASILDKRPGDAPEVKDKLRAAIDAVPALMTDHRRAVLEALDTLQPGGALLHGDLHPGNVFVDGETVTVIDWDNAARGPAAADIARTLHLISPEAIPPDFPDRDEILAALGDFTTVYLHTITGLTGTPRGEVNAWTLPVLAARLSEGIEWEQTAIRTKIDELSE